jgi:hypothetical protein
MASTRSGKPRLAVVAFTLLGAGLLIGLATRPLPCAGGDAAPADRGALPADLARVPADAVGLVSVRVADLWNHEAVAGLHEPLGKEHPEVLQGWEKLIGVPPADTERLTLVFPEFAPQSEPTPLAFVATAKPFEKAKVLAAVAPGAKVERRKDLTLYVGGNNQERGVYFISDRAYVTSTADEVRSFLERPVAKKEGHLGAALLLAAEKHAIVAGLDAATIAKLAEGSLPPEADPFRPLLKTQSATLTVDLGEQVKAQARLSYPAEKDAREAEKAAKAGLALARQELHKAFEELGRQSEGMPSTLAVLNHLKEGLKEVSVEQKETGVELTFHYKPDLSEVRKALTEAVASIRSSAARIQSQNNLRQIAIAMHNYHDQNGHFPTQAVYGPDGKALLSWRVLILPYIEQDKLYKEFHLDEPWDSEHNKKLLARMPKTYLMPGSPEGTTDTFYLGFHGKGAFFDGKKGLRLPADFPDGTSNTIMIVEAAKGVPWTKPEDLPYDAQKQLPKLGGHFPRGFNASLVDGSVRFISSSISETTLRNAITRDDGQPLGDDF